MRNRSRIARSGLWPLAVFLVFTAAAVWAGHAFFERLKQEERAVAASTLTSVGKLKAEQIRSHFARDEKFALSIARLLGHGGLADWLDRASAPSEMPKPLQESLSIVLRNRAGSGLLVLDTTAKLRFGAGQFTQLTEEGRRLALRALAEPQPVVSDIYRGDPSAPEQALLDTFVPIQSPDGARTVGVLVLRNDLAYLYDLIQTWPVESPTAESLLVRLEGDHALFLNELRFRKQTALRMQVPLSAGQDFPGWPSTAAVRGQVGIWEARDYLDHAILAYTLPVAGPVPGWGMVVKMDLAEVFAPVQRLKNTTVGVTVSFILLALLALGSWLWLLQKNADREIAERERIVHINDQLEQRVRERTAELERANLVLHESETRFRMMVEGVTDYAILMLDRDGRVVSWNAGAERLKGYRADEIIGEPFSRFYPEEDVALGKPAKELETAASEGRFEDEGWRVRKDGSRFWANAVMTALRDEAGHLRGFSKITRDLTERRQADEALELERSKLTAAFENTNMGFVLSDGQGANISMNAAALRFHGFKSVAEMHGRLGEYAEEWELSDPDGRVIPFAGWPLARAIRGESFRDCEVHLRKLESGYQWVCSYTGVPVRNSTGEVGLIVLTLLDITERKRTEEEQKQARAALVRSEERFVALIEFAPDAMVVSNARGEIVLVNGQAERRFGYGREELLGKPVEILVPERFRGGHPGHRSSYMANPRVRAMGAGRDLYGLRKDGTEFPVEIGLSPLETEEGRLVSSAIRDVSERRQMEETLRASEARYQDLYENAPDMFVSVDAATARILQCNQTLAAATGYMKGEIVGRPILEMYHPDCLEEAGKAFQAFVETGEVRDRELQLKRKDGSQIDVSLNVRAVRNADGRILHIMSTWRDITERKRREELQRRTEEMEEQNRRIQEANRLKSEFLANMSHELRTPLNAILGFAQLMHDGKVGAVSDQHREYLGDILTSGRHLLQLVNDVLDLAKVESGKMEFQPEPVDLSRLVGEVRDILRTLAAEKRVFVETAVDPALTGVVTDPRRLKQVLYNYLSNALKFTPEGGRATVRVGPEGAEALRLEVEDTGVGIRPEDLGRLFVEFQQLDTGAGKRHPGTGLGLALTRRIVEVQGGHVGVRSTPGQGSVFFAVLPRRPRGAAQESREIAAHPRTAAPLVLVIEDDAKDLAWLEATLGGAGYAALSARTGGEALARCQDTAFDAIVLDILLPDMSGWDALRAIRAAGLNRETPTIVVTVVAEKGAGAGFFVHDYLAKPVQPQDLLASLTRAGVPPNLVRPILVVEDDPADRRLMEVLLKQLGYRPLVRPDGASGLEAAVEDPPAAVVLDLLMPGMDGFQFLERFRRTAIGRRAPVIVWTAHDLTAAVLSRLKDSAQAVVEKSRGADALLEELRAHVLPARAARG